MYRIFDDLDINAVQSLIAQLGYAVKKEKLAAHIAIIRKMGGEIFVGESGGMVAGCVSVVIDARLAEGVNAEIVSLVVDTRFRGQGLGKGLIGEAEKWAAARADTIRIRANSIREDAHLYYKGLGYLEMKTQKIFSKTIA